MAEKRIRLTRSGVTPVEFEDALARAWAELRLPTSRSYSLAKEIVDSPEQELPATIDEVASVVPESHHLDPATGAVLLVVWLGEKVADKVADKVLDMLWDRVIAPRLEEWLGKGSFSEEPGDSSSGKNE